MGEKQLGIDQASRLRRGLDNLIIKREKNIKRLRATIKASTEQTERDRRISPELWDIKLD